MITYKVKWFDEYNKQIGVVFTGYETLPAVSIPLPNCKDDKYPDGEELNNHIIEFYEGWKTGRINKIKHGVLIVILLTSTVIFTALSLLQLLIEKVNSIGQIQILIILTLLSIVTTILLILRKR